MNNEKQNTPIGLVAKVKYYGRQFFQKFTPSKAEFKNELPKALFKTVILVGGIAGACYIIYVAAILAYLLFIAITTLLVLGLLAFLVMGGLGGGLSSLMSSTSSEEDYYDEYGNPKE